MAKFVRHGFCSSKGMTARILVYLMFVGWCLSCSTPEHVLSTSETPANDPFELLDARVEGDALVLRVQYSGGSQAHDFELHSVAAPTKSLPRQVILTVHHNAYGDRSRAMMAEERTFDLTPYRDSRNNVVHLRIQGVDEVLVYHYTR